MLYGGANLVPIAVPLNWFKVFLLKVKILFFSTTFASSTNVEVLTFFSVLNSRLLIEKTDLRHCGILGYKLETSTEHKVISLGRFIKERSFLENH